MVVNYFQDNKELFPSNVMQGDLISDRKQTGTQNSRKNTVSQQNKEQPRSRKNTGRSHFEYDPKVDITKTFKGSKSVMRAVFYYMTKTQHMEDNQYVYEDRRKVRDNQYQQEHFELENDFVYNMSLMAQIQVLRNSKYIMEGVFQQDADQRVYNYRVTQRLYNLANLVEKYFYFSNSGDFFSVQRLWPFMSLAIGFTFNWNQMFKYKLLYSEKYKNNDYYHTITMKGKQLQSYEYLEMFYNRLINPKTGSKTLKAKEEVQLEKLRIKIEALMDSDSGPGFEMRLIADEAAEELESGTFMEYEYFFKLNKVYIMDDDNY